VTGHNPTGLFQPVQAVLVLPYLTVEEALGFQTSDILAPSVDVTILGQQVPIPENLILPGNPPAHPEYVWPSPDGIDQSLMAVAGEVPVGEVLGWLFSGGGLADLVGLLDTYRVGLSGPFSVSGDTEVDFAVDHELDQTLTINYGNVPSGYDLFFLSAGDLEGLNGNGPIIPLGLDLTPGDLNTTGSGTVALTSAARSGELADLTYLAGVVAAQLSQVGDPLMEQGLTAIVDRAVPAPPAAVTANSFFQIVSASVDGDDLFSFSDAQAPGSPAPALSVSQVSLVVETLLSGEYQRFSLPRWTVLLPGSETSFPLIRLPAEAPPFLDRPWHDPVLQVYYGITWDVSVYGFTTGGPFDYDAYDHASFASRITHVSRDRVHDILPGFLPSAPQNAPAVAGDPDPDALLTLAGSPFSDPDPGQTHTASRWQVRAEDGGYDAPVFDHASAADLTQVSVPAGVLEMNRTYFWRVQYRDSDGMWSACSAETAFHTCTLGADCADPLWCNGDEACADNVCQTVPRDCADGLVCTVDGCDEQTDACLHAPEHGLCNDGHWCNGTEVCHPVYDCQPGTDPCPDDGAFCNGAETCDEGGDRCLHTGSPCGDDGNDCTLDACNEPAGRCDHACSAADPSDPCCADPACHHAAACGGAPAAMPWIDLLLLLDE